MTPNKVNMVYDLIGKPRRIFKIPVYQRSYDWGREQCDKLFKDIVNAAITDKPHFMGTAVYISESYSSTLGCDLIIDGQQRIITAMILMKALLDTAAANGEIALKEEITDLLFLKNYEKKQFSPKMIPVKSDREQFNAILKSKSEESEDNNFAKNYRLFIKSIADCASRGITTSDILKGMKLLVLVEIVLDVSQGDNPQVIFESINSTGLELTLSDLIRNFTLMTAGEQERLYEEYWMVMEERVGKENLEDYFLNFLNFRLKENVKHKYAYDRFKKYCELSKSGIEGVLADLAKYSRTYAALICRKSGYPKKVKELLKEFYDLEQSTLYPFLFSVFDDYEGDIISENTLIKVLQLLRSYTVFRLICEIPSNTLRGLFKTLYSRLYGSGKDESTYYERLYSFLASVKTKDRLPDESEVANKLLTVNLYDKKRLCRYVLLSLESENKETLSAKNLTIEHVLPQTKNSASWKNALNGEYERTYDLYLHTLGNLTLTGYNSELSAKPFEEKQKIIKKWGRALTLNSDITAAECWNEYTIIKRAQKLSDNLLKLLKFEKTAITELETTSDAMKIYLNDADATPNTKPQSLCFNGETIAVSSYAQGTEEIVKRLYEIDPETLTVIAKSRYKMNSSERIVISNSERDVMGHNHIEVNDAGIYVDVHFSTPYLFKLLGSLLDFYDIDRNNLYFTLKSKGKKTE